MVNLAEHQDGRKAANSLSHRPGLSGNSPDPGVGRFLEFRIVRDPAEPDISQAPFHLIPNPHRSEIPVVRERTFEFGRGAKQTSNDPVTPDRRPRGIGTDNRAARARGELRPSLGGATMRHARIWPPEKRRRRLGSPGPHPLRARPT